VQASSKLNLLWNIYSSQQALSLRIRDSLTTAFYLRVGQEEPQSFLQAEADSEQNLKKLIYVAKKESKVNELNAIIGITLEAKQVELTNVSFEVDKTQGGVEEVDIKKAKLALYKLSPSPRWKCRTGFEALKGLPGLCISVFSKRLQNEDLVKLPSRHENKMST
jgi:hypothetical protein